MAVAEAAADGVARCAVPRRSDGLNAGVVAEREGPRPAARGETALVPEEPPRPAGDLERTEGGRVRPSFRQDCSNSERQRRRVARCPSWECCGD